MAVDEDTTESHFLWARVVVKIMGERCLDQCRW